MTFPQDARLYGILDLGYCPRRNVRTMAASMIEGGIDVLQVRAKNLAESEIERVVVEVREGMEDSKIPLLINDYPQLVGITGADGVHVGQDDRSVAEARQLAGEGAIVGKSTHSLAQAHAAAVEGADYLGFGPLFATLTKPDYIPIGTRDVRRVYEEIPIPVFCIGGINVGNLASVLAAGAQRVVVVSGILLAEDVVHYTRSIARSLGT